MLTGLEAVFFYLFAFVAVAAAFMVIAARNPVHSVLYLILTFFNAAALFLLTGAEFLAMIMLVVYVGAVAVLFLFVVMMLDVDFAELKRGLADYLPVGALVGLVLLVELSLVLGHWALAGAAPESREAVFAIEEGVANTPALGAILYDKYLYMFQAAGLILLVAMIGAIVLTLRHRPNVKRQDVLTQIYRGRDVELKDVEPGQGV